MLKFNDVTIISKVKHDDKIIEPIYDKMHEALLIPFVCGNSQIFYLKINDNVLYEVYKRMNDIETEENINDALEIMKKSNALW